MPGKLSFKNTFSALEQAMNIAKQRHSLISGNISNSQTPDYRPKEIDFKTAMARALNSGQKIKTAKTDPRHIDVGTNSISGVEPFEEKGDWNGYNWVNIDREMTKLLENNSRYKMAAEMLLRRVSILKEVIREGGR